MKHASGISVNNVYGAGVTCPVWLNRIIIMTLTWLAEEKITFGIKRPRCSAAVVHQNTHYTTTMHNVVCRLVALWGSNQDNAVFRAAENEQAVGQRVPDFYFRLHKHECRLTNDTWVLFSEYMFVTCTQSIRVEMLRINRNNVTGLTSR